MIKEFVRNIFGSLRLFFTIIAIIVFGILILIEINLKPLSIGIWNAYIALSANLIGYVISEGKRKS